MMKIKVMFSLSIGYANCRHEEEMEMEFSDDTPRQEIEDAVAEAYDLWSQNYINAHWSWEKIEGE